MCWWHCINREECISFDGQQDLRKNTDIFKGVKDSFQNFRKASVWFPNLTKSKLGIDSESILFFNFYAP